MPPLDAADASDTLDTGCGYSKFRKRSYVEKLHEPKMMGHPVKDKRQNCFVNNSYKTILRIDCQSNTMSKFIMIMIKSLLLKEVSKQK